jgi:hypothetical protein
MTEPINLAAFRQQRLKLTPAELRFNGFIHELREWPLQALVEALIAAREVSELASIVDKLAALIIHCTTASQTVCGGPAHSQGD